MMTTYIASYFAASVFSFCYSKSREKFFSLCFLMITFAILFLPLAFRHNVGTDYENYARIVGKILNGHVWYKLEYGYFPIVWLMKKFDLGMQFFFIVPALLQLVALLYVVPKKYAYFCIPSYVCVSWIDSFSLVRQAFAAVIFCVAIKRHINGEYFKAFIWGIIAGLYHSSLFILLMLLPFTRLKWNVLSPYFNAVFFTVLCGGIAVTHAATLLMNTIVAKTPYARYIDSVFAAQQEMGTGLGLMLKEFIFAMVLFFSSRDKNLERDIRYNLICIFTTVFGIAHMLTAQIHIFGRMFHLFDPFYVFMLISVYEGGSKWRKWIIRFITFSMFVIYVKLLKDNPSSAWGGLGLVPYESIFSR